MSRGSPAAPTAPPHAPPPDSPDWVLMLRKFVRHGKSIASFAPSSPYLSRMITRDIDYDRATCIVELGAGTGPVTRELVRRVKPGTRLVVVELDPDFCVRLRKKFPNAEIVEGDATKLDTLLAERGIRAVDYIVSGLPLPSFPDAVRAGVLDSSAKVLGERGEFRQLTVMPWVYRKLYKGYFDEVTFKLVPLNLPPAGVYLCRGYKSTAAVAV